jgi:hypothetical protein
MSGNNDGRKSWQPRQGPQPAHELAALHRVVDVLAIEKRGKFIDQDERKRPIVREHFEFGFEFFRLHAFVEDDKIVGNLGEVDVDQERRDPIAGNFSVALSPWAPRPP